MSEAQKRIQMLGVLSVVMMAWLVPAVGNATTPPVATSPTAPMPMVAKSSLSATMMKAPLSFEANHGQTDSSVKFIARGKGHALFLTPTESVLVLQQPQAVQDTDQLARHAAHRSEPATIKQSVVRMKLEGANPTPAVEGMELLPGVANYFHGNNPRNWHTQIPTYARVRYTEAYPGIDVVYYGNQGQLEYDFIVAPGADPNHIKLTFEGASAMRVTESGDLLLTTALGDVQMQKPLVYQLEQDGQKTLVAGNYLASPHTPKEIGFQLAAYDATRSLIIDPSLSYSTYLGGSARDIAYGVAVDATGNAYVTGGTASLDFPLTTGAVLTVTEGNFDVIVTKFNPTGSALVYSTTLGGSVNDFGLAIAVDATGSASVTGWTQSSNFPTTSGAFQTAAPNTSSAFVAKLNPTGTGLVYSTYLGGSVPDTAPGYPTAIVIPSEGGESIALDAAGNAYITGRSTSSNFPTTPGALQTTSAGCGGVFYYTCTGFVTKLNPTGSVLVYSTYLGGTGGAAGYGIAVDATGNAYVTGVTFYTPFFPTTPGAYKTPACGGVCPFVTKLNPTGSALIYSSFFGGSGFQDQSGLGIAVDAAGNAYVAGRTNVSDFPTTAGAFQPVKSSSFYDAFVTKLNPAGSGLVYSTYLGGISADNIQQHGHIAVDVAGNAYVTSTTDSAVFPTTPGAFQPTLGGGRDVFVTQLNAAGSGLVYSSYLGGSADDFGIGIAVDTRSPANAYVTGQTFSRNFPTTTGAFQTTNPAQIGASSAFVVMIGALPPVAKVGADQTVNGGTLVTLDGSASSDPNNKPLTYTWTQVAGPIVVLNIGNPIHPTFTAPAPPIGGVTLTFQLSVNNGLQTSFPVTANVTVKYSNHPPVVNAGPNQTVGAGSLVTLDGSASYDPDGDIISYQWTQTGGPTVALSSATAVKPTFTAPPVSSGNIALSFQLTVSDGFATSTALVSINDEHVNHSPMANAGPNQTINDTKLVTLDGSASSDPDSDSLTYAWTQQSGTPVTFSNPAEVKPTFTAPIVSASGDTLVFQLTVTDPGQLSSTATTKVTVVHQNPVCTAAQASQAVLWPPNHNLLPVKILGVTDPDNLSTTIAVTTVTQDEPVNGLGDGDTSPDAMIQGQGVLLRAERAGSGSGRVYQITFAATDSKGGICTGTVKVSVPHNKQSMAIDDGQLYNSLLP